MTLRERRDLGAILRDSLAFYGAHARLLLGIAFAITAVVDVIVLGIGLGQFSGPYDDTPSLAQQAVELGVTGLVTTPLVTAAVIDVLRAGEPTAGRAIQSGLDVFPHVLVVIVLYTAAATVGTIAFIVPGVIAAIRLLFGIQVVVLEGGRGVDALRRSWRLTAGSFWRVLGIYVVLLIATGVAGALVSLPLAAAASSANSAFLGMLGAIISQTVVGPYAAIATTLLYFDLVDREADRAAVRAPEEQHAAPR